MSPWTAQRMGAIVGAALAIVGVVWLRTRAKPCPGAVTLEFHPPLADPGTYHFRLAGPELAGCAFDVTLPNPQPQSAHGQCGMARELRTQVRDGQVSISELTFAAAPEHFTLQVKRGSELVYDANLQPKYAPYPILRAENKVFCGARARLLPHCLRGSSQCLPFPASCTGPEGCAHGQVCCVNPDWAREFGPHAASLCATRDNCFAQLGQVACHADSDCPADLNCKSSTLSADFSPTVQTCLHR